jgi:hypothetical protein
MMTILDIIKKGVQTLNSEAVWGVVNQRFTNISPLALTLFRDA